MSTFADPFCLVLLVEDEAIIAMNLEDDLQRAGYGTAGPFGTCAAALDWMSGNTPDLAILDTLLKDGSCRTIAAELTRRDVPFVICSGTLQAHASEAEFAGATWISKPAPPDAILDALSRLRLEAKRTDRSDAPDHRTTPQTPRVEASK
jgi:DNA-binding NtrC family response regulator